MAYSRKSSARRYNNRRKTPWYRKKYDAMSLAAKAAKGVWYLKGLVNSEMDHHIVSAGPAVSTTGTVVHLTAMSQGTSDVDNRVGNSVLLRSILGRMEIVQNASATNTLYRMILFVDKQQQGDTSPAVGDILASSSTLSSLTTGQAGRFKILKNWFFSTDSTKGTTKVINFYKDMRMHVRYNGAASSDIQKNGIYLLLLSDQGTNTPTIYYNFKLGYHDN